ncbi:hypothetical protein GN316_15280 [Xylophilus sp. Kf1]|nr:hypothetical protein [Xylophilus sp. Kf1]
MHFVWCSEYFDCSKLSAYSPAFRTAGSSDPYSIYYQFLKESKGDRHAPKIREQKLSLTTLAAEWLRMGEIDERQSQEIVYMVNNAEAADWGPLLYVIPRIAVADRLKPVAIENRASFAMEYIVPDLQRSEFNIIEVHQ